SVQTRLDAVIVEFYADHDYLFPVAVISGPNGWVVTALAENRCGFESRRSWQRSLQKCVPGACRAQLAFHCLDCFGADLPPGGHQIVARIGLLAIIETNDQPRC